MLFDGVSHQLPDADPTETSEWLDAFDDVVDAHGRTRARYLLMRILERARQKQVDFPATVSSPYVNTIPSDEEPEFPGDEYIERRIRAFIRWNAAVMVVRANVRSEAIGGHLSTYASSASLYEVGFNHFFRGKDRGPGDQVYFQGHASPGIYARAFVEGRLSEEDLDNFRFEVGTSGLSSYPHPRLMPHFWEYPTVSMGLGPLNAIAQAHVSRYLHARGLVDTSDSRVWCFVGDGEFDEPETLGALGMAGREHLDNLVFVVNCNLQRLDGPVRGNGKVIQEFEALFRGAGWNVIKVIWGRTWDELLAKDVEGVLLNKMNSTVDGEFQKYATESGAYIREHFFGPDPRLTELVAHLTDEELQSLPRGGHDYRKLYAAYQAATEHVGAPTAILAKTIKGWTLGPEIEARNATHQIKKMTKLQLLTLRNRLFLHDEIPEEDLEADLPPYYRPAPDEKAALYLAERRRALGGALPSRVDRSQPLPPPEAKAFADLFAGSGRQAVSTTMAFARLLRSLVRDPAIGKRIVPIVSDEARTFGLESLISEVQIYSPEGQRYTPVDADLALHYAESSSGQVLEEGISEAGAVAAFTAAATSYATWGEPMIPFYLFYSMFGFQRVGRPPVGARRRAWAWLPPRMHRRPHHPQRRRSPAPGRALPASGLDRPERGRLRPRLLLRGGGHRGRRHPAHDRSRAGGPVLVPHPLQRELPDALAPARPCRGRAGPARLHQGHLPVRPRVGDVPEGPTGTLRTGTFRTATRRPGPPSCSRGRPGRARWRPGGCWPPTGGWTPTCGRSPRTSRCARRPWPSSAGTASTRTKPSGFPTSPSSWPRQPARSWRSATSCGPCPTRSPVGCRGRSPLSAPTATDDRTPGRSCGATSRWMPPMWWWPSSTPWPPKAWSRPRPLPTR